MAESRSTTILCPCLSCVQGPWAPHGRFMGVEHNCMQLACIAVLRLIMQACASQAVLDVTVHESRRHGVARLAQRLLQQRDLALMRGQRCRFRVRRRGCLVCTASVQRSDHTWLLGRQ